MLTVHVAGYWWLPRKLEVDSDLKVVDADSDANSVVTWRAAPLK